MIAVALTRWLGSIAVGSDTVPRLRQAGMLITDRNVVRQRGVLLAVYELRIIIDRHDGQFQQNKNRNEKG